MSALIISELIRILNDMEILLMVTDQICNNCLWLLTILYLLNYFAEVLGISLKGVFHHSSSVSVFIFCCTNMSMIASFIETLSFNNEMIMSKNSISKTKYNQFSNIILIIQNLFSKFQISKKNFQIFSTFVIMVGFEPTQLRVTYFLSLTLSRNLLTFSAVT